MTVDEFVPKAMFDAAMGVWFQRAATAVEGGPEDHLHAILQAILDTCRVKEEAVLRGQWEDGEVWTMFPPSMATGHRWLREAVKKDPTARLMRRLVITTPAEEVPHGS